MKWIYFLQLVRSLSWFRGINEIAKYSSSIQTYLCWWDKLEREEMKVKKGEMWIFLSEQFIRQSFVGTALEYTTQYKNKTQNNDSVPATFSSRSILQPPKKLLLKTDSEVTLHNTIYYMCPRLPFTLIARALVSGVRAGIKWCWVQKQSTQRNQVAFSAREEGRDRVPGHSARILV